MIFWNFFTAWVRVQWFKFRGYKVLTDPVAAQMRFHRCDQCIFFGPAGECKVCGCPVISKIQLNTEKCPIDRWGRIYEKK